MTTNILIIKLGALGDVIRTMPLLLGLKEKFPDSKITWITKPNVVEILKTAKEIDNVFSLGEEVKDSFDLLYNFDMDDEATFLAEKIFARKKYGFYSSEGFVQSFNLGAEYYLNTTFDDELKKTNKKQ